MPSLAEFSRYFSIPRTPNTITSPGQFVELKVPKGKKVVITDIYVENLGGGEATVRILEQRLPTSFEVRYAYNTKPGEVLSINLSTGLRLGDEAPIKNTVRVENYTGSAAGVLVRINGQLVG